MTIKTANNEIYEEAREKFFSYLLKRPCTKKQAENFLLRSNLPENISDSLMNEALISGMIDDKIFAKLFVDGHLSWGNAKISYELGSKGVSKEDINTALEESEDEISRALELSESWKKIGLSERKISSRLSGRGFSHRSIREALND